MKPSTNDEREAATANAYNTYVAPQAAYCSCSGAVSQTRARKQAAQSKPAHGLRPETKQPYAALVCPFNGIHLRNPCSYGLQLIDRPQRDGRLSWPGWLTHCSHFTHEVVTCQPQIRRRTKKVCQPKTDVLTTEPRRQMWSDTRRRCKMLVYNGQWQLQPKFAQIRVHNNLPTRH